MGPVIAVMLDKIVEIEDTTRTALVRKIIKQYCNYYFDNGNNIELNTSIVWSNPREQ